MRVAVDAFNLLADRRGMGRITLATLRYLCARDDAEVTLLVRKSGSDEPYRALLNSARFSLAPAPTAKRRGRYDVVWYPWNAMRFTSAAPTVVSIMDPFAFTYPHPEFIARRREQMPIERALARATRILTISQWSKNEFVQRFAVQPGRIAVVPVLPEPMWTPAPADDTPERDGAAPYVLLVGAEDARKNAAMLVEAFADAFARDGYGVELRIIGTMSAAAIAAARARGVRVRNERVDDTVLRDYYRRAAAVAVPSLAEGFGLVVVEAMACGAPVVASNATAIPQAARGAALLVDPTDRRAWSEALRAVVENEELARKLRAQSAAAYAATPPDLTARAIYDELRSVCESAGAPL